MQVIQLAATGLLSYFTNILNYLDWFCYCSAIAVTYNSTNCNSPEVLVKLIVIFLVLAIQVVTHVG